MSKIDFRISELARMGDPAYKVLHERIAELERIIAIVCLDHGGTISIGNSAAYRTPPDQLEISSWYDHNYGCTRIKARVVPPPGIPEPARNLRGLARDAVRGPHILDDLAISQIMEASTPRGEPVSPELAQEWISSTQIEHAEPTHVWIPPVPPTLLPEHLTGEASTPKEQP